MVCALGSDICSIFSVLAVVGDCVLLRSVNCIEAKPGMRTEFTAEGFLMLDVGLLYVVVVLSCVVVVCKATSTLDRRTENEFTYGGQA